MVYLARNLHVHQVLCMVAHYGSKGEHFDDLFSGSKRDFRIVDHGEYSIRKAIV